MTRASSTSPSLTQSHARPKKHPNEPANTMDEPGGPEAPLAELEAEQIARAAAKRSREEGSRNDSHEPAHYDEVVPDFKPPMAPDSSGDGEI